MSMQVSATTAIQEQHRNLILGNKKCTGIIFFIKKYLLLEKQRGKFMQAPAPGLEFMPRIF